MWVKILTGITSIITIFSVLFIFIFIGGIIFSWCWNYCIPTLFGLPEITYLQSVALLAIARILLPLKNTNK